MKEKGRRYNTGKAKWGLVPFFALIPMVKVLEFGSRKYDDWNWTKGLSWVSTYESMLRHTFDSMFGEDHDKESKILHIGHIMCNILFISYYFLTGKGQDDRFKLADKTTEAYWDCECDENYIHSKEVTQCNVCGAVREDQPESRVKEVVEMNLKLISLEDETGDLSHT